MLADASASTGAIICAPLISAAPSSAEAGAGASSVSGRDECARMTPEEVEMLAEMESTRRLITCLLSDLPDAELRRAFRFSRAKG